MDSDSDSNSNSSNGSIGDSDSNTTAAPPRNLFYQVVEGNLTVSKGCRKSVGGEKQPRKRIPREVVGSSRREFALGRAPAGRITSYSGRTARKKIGATPSPSQCHAIENCVLFRLRCLSFRFFSVRFFRVRLLVVVRSRLLLLDSERRILQALAQPHDKDS